MFSHYEPLNTQSMWGQSYDLLHMPGHHRVQGSALEDIHWERNERPGICPGESERAEVGHETIPYKERLAELGRSAERRETFQGPGGLSSYI